MQIVSKAQLKQWIDSKQDMLLIDVLPRESFNKQHLPGAINIPVMDNPNFAKDVEAKARTKNQQIVVYCANMQCDASQQAAKKLENAGFNNVKRYEEGLEGWFGSKAAAA
jgi:rhodanese-related sulfurtransferase